MITGEPVAVTPIDGNAALAAQTPVTTPSTPITQTTGTASLLDAATGGTTSQTKSSPWSINEEGNFEDGWLDRLPDEYKDSKQMLGNLKNPDSMAKSLINAQRLLGKKSEAVLIPNEKSPPEEWAEFNSRRGVPESADKYPTTIEGLKAQPDPTVIKSFNELAHKTAMTPAQQQEAVKFYAEIESKRSEVATQQKQAELQAMQKDLVDSWGEKFDQNKVLAERVAQSIGLGTDTSKWTVADMVKGLVRMGQMVSDDKIVGGDSSPTFQVGSVKARDIMMNPQNPNHQRWLSGDKEIRETVMALLKQG